MIRNKIFGLVAIALVFMMFTGCPYKPIEDAVELISDTWERDGTRTIMNLNTDDETTVNIKETLVFKADGTLSFTELNKDTSAKEEYTGTYKIYVNGLLENANYTGVLMLSIQSESFGADRGYYISFVDESKKGIPQVIQLLNSSEEGALPIKFRRFVVDTSDDFGNAGGE